MKSPLTLAAALVLITSSVAFASPAVVTKNTTARSAPFDVAPVVGTLLGGDKINADDTATNGWRRVELPGGKFGYVPDGDLKVEPAPPRPPAPKPVAAPAATEKPAPVPTFAAPAETPAAADAVAPVQALSPGATAGRPVPQYVGDFSHLASLVKTDSEVSSMADGIATRQTASSMLIWGGVFGGLLLTVLADTALANESCFSPSNCYKVTNAKVRNIGIDLLVLGPLIGWAIRPTRDDKTDVINLWNGKHPDRPFVDRAGIEAP